MKSNKNQVISIISIICIVLFGFLYNNLINKNKIIISSSNEKDLSNDDKSNNSKSTPLYSENKDETTIETKVTSETKEEVETPQETEIPKDISVYITGEIKNAGVYSIKKDTRINDVVALAGGLTENADVKKINLAKIVLDEEHIHVFAIGDSEIVTNDYISNPTEQKSDIININTADMVQLMKLPSVGEVTATNIIAYRNENGNFKTIEDIKNVKRIGDITFDKIKDLIVVN